MKHRYSETLRRCAKYMAAADLPLREVARLERMLEPCRGENFELGEALHWFCAENYAGQADPLYSLLCALDYTPGRCERGPDPDNMFSPIFDAYLKSVGK